MEKFKKLGKILLPLIMINTLGAGCETVEDVREGCRQRAKNFAYNLFSKGAADSNLKEVVKTEDAAFKSEENKCLNEHGLKPENPDVKSLISLVKRSIFL